MPQQEPKKRRPRSKKLNLTTKAIWGQLLKEVNTEEVPITLLNSLTINLKDGTKVLVNIRELLDQGYDPDLIEDNLNRKLQDLDDYIEDVDFMISIESVAGMVQPITDNILKDL